MGAAGAPSVRFATTRDGHRIAYGISGDGPPLVYVRALNSHAERWWTEQWTGRYLETLGRAFSVVQFDARGNGLSGHADAVDLAGLLDDLCAVVEEAGLDEATIYGQGFGSPVAIAFAAEHPEQVTRLLLYCAYAYGPSVRISDGFIQTMRTMPEAAAAFMGHATYPDEERLPRRLTTLETLNAPPETAAAYFEFARSVDVRDRLGRVGAPTLVMQPEHSPVIPSALGREVAEGIAGTSFVGIPGGSYNPWGEVSFDASLRAIGEFVGATIPLMPTPKRLAVLLTDIVGSTEMTHRLGEERARQVFHTHDAIVAELVRSHGGSEVKHTGDGTMATFRDARSAVACAVQIERRLAGGGRRHDDDLLVRIGIALGDVVEERGDLFGMTVMLAVRITDGTEADQILVSEAVYEDVRGGFEFREPRATSLKGFPEPQRVYEVRWDVQQ